MKDGEKERSQNEENEEEDECTDDNGGVGFDLGGLRRFPRLGSATAARGSPPRVSRPAPIGSEVAHLAHFFESTFCAYLSPRGCVNFIS